MPVLVEPDGPALESLLKGMPAGAQVVSSPEAMGGWIDAHSEEYVVVLGPALDVEHAIVVCEELRAARPAVSVILVRESLDTVTLTRAMKAGARDVVAAGEVDALQAAVDQAGQLFMALRGPSGAQEGTVITVFSPKGGVGKTTVSVNLALALARTGAHKVCLVDLDLAFGDVAITMQLFPTHSIEHAVGSEDAVDLALLEPLLTRHQDSLMVLAAPAQPDVRERITPQLVSRVLRTLRTSFDYLVVDTAPSLDDHTLTVLDETDELVLVATMDVPTLKNVKIALETLDLLNIASEHRHLVLNRADEQAGISPDKVEAILGMDVAAVIESSMEIAAATNAGSPIVAAKPQHGSSQVIGALAARLSAAHTGLSPGLTPQGDRSSKPGRRGLFRRRGGDT